MSRTAFGLFFLALFTGIAPVAQAALAITGTRIIYEEERREATIQIANNQNDTVLAQFWLDTGDADADPSLMDVPFQITPPVIRIEGKQGQTVRLLRTSDTLPKDRESIFWFNMLEVPPRPSQTDLPSDRPNFIQVATRTRIKLFYRPARLSMPVQQAMAHLTFKVDRSARQLVVQNASPYHLTFRNLKLASAETAPAVADLPRNKMVAPFDSLSLPLDQASAVQPGATKVFYTLINDFGGNSAGSAELTAD